jgi:hypothetical protein
MSIDIDGTLAQRGILDVATKAGWQACNGPKPGGSARGWSYPVYDFDSQPYDRPRWKAANGSDPRYYWPKGQPKRSKYYFLPGLRTAIQSDGGTVYIAAGEPDVLTYHAAGIENTFCWLAAEISIPDTLISDLRKLEVKTVIYAPDRDDAGMRAAAKLYKMLEGAGFTYHLAELPAPMGSKFDVNDLWQQVNFDKSKFFVSLWQKHVDTTDLALYADAPRKVNVSAEKDKWYLDWLAEIEKALPAPDARVGRLDYWRCPISGRHHKGDANPSFRISRDQKPDLPWPVCSCDIQNAPDPWSLLADALGAPSWGDYQQARAWSDLGIRAGADGKPELRPGSEHKPPIVSINEAYSELLDIIDGGAPDSVPIRFPYEVLHRFEGYAQWMWTGKAVAVGGISGGGKTLLLRVLFIAMLNAGYDMIWWGPEFSPQEYAIQDLIRAGGLTFSQINTLYVVRALQHKHGISQTEAVKRSGLSMPGAAALEESKRKINEMRARRGELFIINDLKRDVKDVMTMASAWADARRKEGREVGGIGWDYLQLTNMAGKRDWSWGNRAANIIKTACAPSEGNMVAFIGTQTRKDDAAKVREGEKLLKVGDAQGLDESIFNLYLTLTPAYLNGNKQDWAIISVEKNSIGGLGRVAVPANWSRLIIADKEHTDVNLEGYLGH